MHIPSKTQSQKSGNWISVDYTVRDFKSYDENSNTYSVNTYSLSLKPTGDFDFNSKEDWRWEGTWIEENDTEVKKIYVSCRNGTDSDISFSDNFPFTFKDQVEKEIKRILRKYN